VHVDEDDRDVLVAGLAVVRIWLVICEHQNGKERERERATNHLVKVLPSLEHLSAVASTCFRPCAAGLDNDKPPAMDGSELPACL
jgi:hypothetical protein